MQEFRRAVKRSEYKKRVLIKEFKREINRVIRQKLIEAERPLTSMK